MQQHSKKTENPRQFKFVLIKILLFFIKESPVEKSIDEILAICSIFSNFFMSTTAGGIINMQHRLDSFTFGQRNRHVINYLWVSNKSESWQSLGNAALLLAIRSWKTQTNSRSKPVYLSSETNTSKVITRIKDHSAFPRTTINTLKCNCNKYKLILGHRIRILGLCHQTTPPPNNISHLNSSFKSGYCRSRDL